MLAGSALSVQAAQQSVVAHLGQFMPASELLQVAS
jgi:hypothetical protein